MRKPRNEREIRERELEQYCPQAVRTKERKRGREGEGQRGKTRRNKKRDPSRRYHEAADSSGEGANDQGKRGD